VYYVTVNIKTPDGMLEIGRYFLGVEKSFAEDTFSALKGSDNVIQHPFIRLDLINTSADPLPVCLKNMGCDLAQYTYNCRILTREVFRHFMFEGAFF
jgi:hypothetical protein